MKSVVKTNLVFIKFLYINVVFMQYPFYRETVQDFHKNIHIVQKQ